MRRHRVFLKVLHACFDLDSSSVSYIDCCFADGSEEEFDLVVGCDGIK